MTCWLNMRGLKEVQKSLSLWMHNWLLGTSERTRERIGRIEWRIDELDCLDNFDLKLFL